MKQVRAMCMVMIGVLTLSSGSAADLVPLAEFSLSAAFSDAQAAPTTASDALGNTVAAFMRQGVSTNGWDILRAGSIRQAPRKARSFQSTR